MKDLDSTDLAFLAMVSIVCATGLAIGTLSLLVKVYTVSQGVCP